MSDLLPEDTVAHPTVCGWQEDEDGVQSTDCGHLWILESGSPPENDMKFCPFCGKTLAWCSYQEPEDDDE